ncbi:MAG: hypothetical protein AB8G99_27425 [Planctomycetaceae bacterium]
MMRCAPVNSKQPRGQMKFLWSETAVLLGLLVLTVTGCNKASDASVNKSKQQGTITKETVNGPVSLLLKVTPDKPALSDTIDVTVEIVRDESLDVRSPDLTELFEDFLVADFKEMLPRIDGDRIVVEHKYKLEPLTPGKVRLNAIPYRFSENEEDEPLVVATKPVTLDVQTIVDKKSPSLIEIGDPVDPMNLPPNPYRHVPLVAGGLFALALLVFFIRRRLKRGRIEPVFTPAQIARRELDELRSSNIAQTEPKEFYVRLTGIVCRFVEGTTRVRAPEQTTGEFLREIEQRDVFSDVKQERFRVFLEAADLVKYAAQEPTERDIESSLQTADAFVADVESDTVEVTA